MEMTMTTGASACSLGSTPSLFVLHSRPPCKVRPMCDKSHKVPLKICAPLQAVCEVCAVCNESKIEFKGSSYKAVGAPTEAALLVSLPGQ
eukprot:1145112-Pelagomonas_calceolata.AAC.8